MIFPKEVKVKDLSDLRFYTTDVPVEKSMGEIRGILETYCERVLTDKKGDHRRVAFIYNGDRYVINIPKVIEVRDGQEDKKNDKIGPRAVKWWMEIYFSWAKAGMIDFEQALLPNKVVQVQGQSVALGEIAKDAEGGSLVGALDPNLKQLSDQTQSKEEPIVVESDRDE